MSANHNHKKGICEICKKEFPFSQLFPLKLIRPSILDTAKKQNPELNCDGYICTKDLREVRADHIENLLHEDKAALSALENEVIDSLENQDILT